VKKRVVTNGKCVESSRAAGSSRSLKCSYNKKQSGVPVDLNVIEIEWDRSTVTHEKKVKISQMCSVVSSDQGHHPAKGCIWVSKIKYAVNQDESYENDCVDWKDHSSRI
jgi:hypothetical protein